MPLYAIDEARREDQLLIQLANSQQSDALATPATAAIEAPAPPATVQVDAHSSSPSSEAMCGLNHGPLNSAAVHQDAQYEDAFEDEDGVRVRGVNDVNELHVMNGLGTNDDFLNVGNELRISDNLRGVPVSAANVCVSTASALSMRVGRDERRMRHEQVSVTQPVVHAAPQSTGAPVSQELSPFGPELVESRSESAPATMSAVTSATTSCVCLPRHTHD